MRAGIAVAGTGIAALLAPGAALGAEPAPPPCTPVIAPGEEATLTALINAQRRAARVATLVTRLSLVRPARSRSIAMARGGGFTHSTSLRWAQGRASAQNIAQAPSARMAFQAMLASAPHRANLLSRAYRITGVGAARDCDGQVFFTINLMAGPVT